MRCKGPHAWQEIFSVNETDYEPGYYVYWCRHCGDAAVQEQYDNRVVSNTPYRVEQPKEVQEKTE